MANAITTQRPVSIEPETVPITTELYETLVNSGAFDQTLGQIQRRFTIRAEKPFRIPTRMSCPELDIAWATRQNYHVQHPSPGDVHPLIEVSHTSSRFDRTEKLRLYAESNITEYWQIDLPGRVVTVHREPKGELFRHVQSFDVSQTISPVCLPDAKLVIANLFPAK